MESTDNRMPPCHVLVPVIFAQYGDDACWCTSDNGDRGPIRPRTRRQSYTKQSPRTRSLSSYRYKTEQQSNIANKMNGDNIILLRWIIFMPSTVNRFFFFIKCGGPSEFCSHKWNDNKNPKIEWIQIEICLHLLPPSLSCRMNGYPLWH